MAYEAPVIPGEVGNLLGGDPHWTTRSHPRFSVDYNVSRSRCRSSLDDAEVEEAIAFCDDDDHDYFSFVAKY